MTHYDTSYKHLPRKEADEKALEDIKEYLGEEIYNNFVKEIEAGIATGDVTAKTINMYFGFAGISGYPYHAFCRKYCLASYREWMHSGKDPVQTDENGYTIK